MLCGVDYGVGNLYSLCSSLAAVGADAVVSGDPEVIAKADKIILPGVGAFGDAAAKLRENGLDEFVKEQAASGTPLMGICLGMQLLFEKSFEYGEHEGLGLIPGQVCPLSGDIAPGLKVPHIGWNRLEIVRDDPLFKYFENGRHVYYVHSFYAKNCAEFTLAASDYSIPVTGVVRKGNVYGAQFHPEKSGEAGLNLLRAFAEMEEAT